MGKLARAMGSYADGLVLMGRKLDCTKEIFEEIQSEGEKFRLEAQVAAVHKIPINNNKMRYLH